MSVAASICVRAARLAVSPFSHLPFASRRANAFAAVRVAGAALCVTLAACTSELPSAGRAATIDPVSLFPLAAYDQNVDHWIDPATPGYDQPFLDATAQRAQFNALYARYFGTGLNDPSPWNPAYVGTRVYREDGGDIVALQQRRIAGFDNTGKPDRSIGYGQNFRPHTKAWIDAIAQNMNVAQFAHRGGYVAAQRAIATGNLLVRELPTMDPSFYDRRLAGEGYPFDNLQISAARPGTPLYVLGSSVDGAWRYVQTPDVQGWAPAADVGRVDEPFVQTWRQAARNALGGIIATPVALRDSHGTFRFDAPVGTLLPLGPALAGGNGIQPQYSVLVPARDIDGAAVIRTGTLDATQIVPLPFSATPRHLAMLLKALIGRPYGWGNTGFYNDCSSELQSIFAVFGVWLPRHSATQMSAGHMIDLSSATPAARLDYLASHGVPMRTLIYIGGHVMLYLGNTTRDGQTVPVVYQDVWGLRPADNSRRAVIGGSVILPLLLHIPEDPDLASLAATSVFQISIVGAPLNDLAAPPAEDNPAS